MQVLELNKNYDVFVIDPPWPQRKGGRRKVRPKQGRDLPYQTLTIEQIFALLDDKIFSHANNPHVVFLWCIDKFLLQAEQEMFKRNYKLHTRHIWDKGNGIAPAFTVRYSHEYLLWFYKPKLLPISKEARGKFTTVFHEPAREHSRKPDIAYQIIHELYPTKTKIDVFSREKRPHYDQFGDQCDYFNGNL